MTDPRVATVEHWLDRLYVAAEGASLRQEDRRKAFEVAAMLAEIDLVVRRRPGQGPFVLVDAAAGKSYLGLLAAKLVLEPLGRPATVVVIERDPARIELSREAVLRLRTSVAIEFQGADVASAAWPEHPSLVTALHACGPAADGVIDGTTACGAGALLLVPCCTGNAVPSADLAGRLAAQVGIPRHAPVRRRFIQAMVDTERTWRLEAAGYETEVVEFVPATVTPHNLLWRSRRVGEPVRMAAAREQLNRLKIQGSGAGG